MELKVSREELKNALAWIQNVVEKKTTKPILANALFECEDNQLKISGTDLEVGIQVKIPVKATKKFALALPAKSVYDIVREIKAEEITFKRKDEGWLEILSGRSRFKVASLPAGEFPTMPTIPQKGSLSLDAPALKTMIGKTLFAVSTDETKYNLNGVYFEAAGEKSLRMVATDGHRLSYNEREMTQKLNVPKPFLLPRKGVTELQKIISEEDGVIPLFLEGRNVIAQRGELALFIRLIEGDFPNYDQVIPKKNDRKVVLSKEQFVGALRRVSLLSQDHQRGVKMTFSSGHLELLCSNPDLGEAREEVECEYKGKHLEVAFNYRYFLDVLAVLEDDKVQLSLKDEVSPCLIHSEVGSWVCEFNYANAALILREEPACRQAGEECH